MKRIVLLLTVFILSLSGITLAGGPEGVSPSGGDPSTALRAGVAVIGSVCPTFSWAEVDASGGYTIEVYPEPVEGSDVVSRDEMASVSEPVISKDLGAALSWTPSSGECLKDGMKYVWYVGSQRTDDREQTTD